MIVANLACGLSEEASEALSPFPRAGRTGTERGRGITRLPTLGEQFNLSVGYPAKRRVCQNKIVIRFAPFSVKLDVPRRFVPQAFTGLDFPCFE